MTTFEEILEQMQPATRTVAVATDNGLAETYARAQAETVEARRRAGNDPRNDDLRKALDEAEAVEHAAYEALVERSVTFTFRALGGEEWKELIAAEEHQPTRDQIADLRRLGADVPRWNRDTFPPAALAACAVDPPMTLEQATALWTGDQLNEAGRVGLFVQVQLLNEASSAVFDLNGHRRRG